MEVNDNDIAIVGMAIRVAGASSPEEYWDNLVSGREAVQNYTEDELLARGVSRSTLSDPNYVRSGVQLQNMDAFDPEFFGFSQKEAAILDPQHRQFYETCWEAIERAGHPPKRFDGAIGVFAGCGMGSYFTFNLLKNREMLDSVGTFLLRHTGNDKDFLSTRVSYLFDLKGPSVSIQTACSTSLVATHMAAQSLLSGECDIALAGGVTIEIPHGVGYTFREGEVLSPDGHCRPFDHRSKGTIFGSGVGVVALRRLSDALEDGDHIHAVIKGSAVNNDGAGKVGYLAPSVEGQSAAVAEALAVADISADTLTYIECHGTATPVGDPIEIAALTSAFRESTTRTGFCKIGSVKSNIGHLDTAAGVASLIKATLAIEHAQIPPSLNYEAPNPHIDFESGPFVVAAELSDWETDGQPRRAGINSLGVGGTNAFVILEQAPDSARSAEALTSGASQFLLLSARNRKALDASSTRLAAWLQSNESASLRDVSRTLATGRHQFEYRRVVACSSPREGAEALISGDARRVFNQTLDIDNPRIVFMFPGGGAQYFQMGAGLYRSEPVFRSHMDAGLNLLKQRHQVDLTEIFHAPDTQRDQVTLALDQPSIQLPLTFLIEYSLTRTWEHYGVTPDLLIGHSMGENTAACISGVTTFEEALGILLLRGQLVEKSPPGGVLSVPIPAAELQVYLGDSLDLASANSGQLSVASGSPELLDDLASRLAADGIESQRVRVNVAAHSRLFDGILGEFREHLQTINFKEPQIPILSNKTGKPLTVTQARDPEYWVEHLRRTVYFEKGVDTLVSNDDLVYLEVGPGNMLGSFVRQNPKAPAQRVLASMRHPNDTTDDAVYFKAAMGRLWALGVEASPEAVWGSARIIPLPTYPFQHSRYWVEAEDSSLSIDEDHLRPMRLDNNADWFATPGWVQQGILETDDTARTWLVFHSKSTLDLKLMEHLRRRGDQVVEVIDGDVFAKLDESAYTLAPEAGAEGYLELMESLAEAERLPDRIVHTWLYTQDQSHRPGSTFENRIQSHGFYALFHLARAFGKTAPNGHRCHIIVAANQSQQVADEPIAHPLKSTALGPCLVIPREFPGISCTYVDLCAETGSRDAGRTPPAGSNTSSDALLQEINAAADNGVVAWRDGVRWQRHIRNTDPQQQTTALALKSGGTYLITGGLGGLGGLIANWLAENYTANLVLIGRTPIPDRAQWDEWLRHNSEDDTISRSIHNIRQIEAAGSRVLALQADVTVSEQVSEAVEVAEQQFGPISGVIHAAGTIRDSLIQLKTAREIEEVFSAKLYGTLVLDEVFRHRTLDFMLLFGSTSAFVAPQGQIDYVGANSFINAFAQSCRGNRKYPVTALNWGIWSDVGLAAPVAAPSGDTHSTRLLSDSAQFGEHRVHREGTREVHEFTLRLSCESDWVINEHRLKSGEALLPGTGYFELIHDALEEIGIDQKLRIHNLVFQTPLFVPETLGRDVVVKLTARDAGWRVVISAGSSEDTGGGDGFVRCATAEVDVYSAQPPQHPGIEEIARRCQRHESSAAGSAALRTRQEDHLQFGPRWHVLKKLQLGDGEALARIELPPEFADDLHNHPIHPALLDISTGCAMDLIPGYADQDVAESLWVPLSYKTFTLHAPLQSTMFSWIRYSKDSVANKYAIFDVLLTGVSGEILAEVDHLTLSRLEGRFSGSEPARQAQPASVEGSREKTRNLSQGEIALHHNVSQGIDSLSGLSALESVLSHPLPAQLIVSSMSLKELVAQAELISRSSAAGASTRFERPELDSDFEAPRDEVERTLAEIWAKLLGVEGVGIHDSFFDLGGHSLVAVRLFNEISDRFDSDLPMSVLMQSPTICGLAEMVRGFAYDPDVESNGTESRAKADSGPKFRYVVPMNSGPVGGRTPLFVVAGMFGNVLNLSHLADLLGEDRPFYALQARGLFGDLEPHESFEAMATDYIEELRRVQPKGPYLLGGFSGGGLIAYEMARQLMQAGESVLRIIMLDTPVREPVHLSLTDKCSMAWQDYQRTGSKFFLEKIRTRLRWREEQRKRQVLAAEETNSEDAHFRSQSIGDAFLRALRKYQVPTLPVSVWVFRPKQIARYHLSRGRVIDHDREELKPDNGWTPYVKELQVVVVPGNHDNMVLEPNVRVLVNAIKRAISDIDDQQITERAA